MSLSQDTIRVTSVNYQSGKYVIFSGVPVHVEINRRKAEPRSITVKSDLKWLPVTPSKGQIWEVSGESLTEQVEHGQYSISRTTYDQPKHVVCTLPETGEELITFIANEPDFRGIGIVKARLLWETFGKSLHSILSEDNIASRERLRLLLSDDSIDALYAGYAKYRNLAYCNWMSKHRIPTDIQRRLIKFHDRRTVEMLNANPYLLVGFGMSFVDVDAMACKARKVVLNARQVALSESEFDVPEDDVRRLSAAVEVAVRIKVEKGHTYASTEGIRASVWRLLGGDSALTQTALSVAQSNAQLVMRNGSFHPLSQLVMETAVAKRFLKLASTKGLYCEDANAAYVEAISDLPYELLAKQSEGVMGSLDNAISCITGGAGTGKTTVLRTALRAYHRLGYTIHAVALSGRAAMRMRESTGFATKTIAAFLREQVVSGESPALLVIDESSMLDIPTMYRLVTHIDPSVRILLTGDPDQLPPIGCGKVLSDVVSSGVIANTRLDIVRRQDGATGIPEYSRRINDGEVPPELSTGRIVFHETTSAKIEAFCAELYCLSPEGSRVVAPTKDLVSKINLRIQGTINTTGEPMQFMIDGDLYRQDLKLGDAILFTKNLYDKDIQNGSLGTLTSVKAEGERFGEVELDTGERVEVTQSVLDCMELGYAMTLHKAQGSQFPRVIIALKQGKIVDRAWFYTAITRAETDVHIVGCRADFERVVTEPSSSSKRKSYLRQLLVDGAASSMVNAKKDMI